MERKVRLPVGYMERGERHPEAVLRPLTGRVLLEARGKIGDRIDPTLFTDILKACVAGVEGTTEPFRPEEMFFVDADFVFYQLAVWEHEMSGEPMRVRRVCQKCGRTVQFELRPEEVTVKNVEDTEWGKYPDLQIPIKFKHPITTLDPEGKPHNTGKLRLLTLGDEVEKFRRYADAPGKLWAETVRRMIAQIGPAKTGDILLPDLENLPAFEIKRIEGIYARNLPGVEPPRELLCPACQAMSAVNPSVMWVPDFLLLPSGE